MTTDELNTIVAAVVAELEKSGVDFDYKAEQAEDDDLVFVIRGTAPNYQGMTVTWKGLLDIITAQATQAKTDAVNAKDIAQQILTQVQSKGTEITNFVATSKTEIETQKNESVEEVRTVYQGDLNELKGDIDNMTFIKDNIIPSDYQEVSYIESTGTQYIDSGVAVTPVGLQMVIDCEITEFIDGYIFGHYLANHGANRFNLETYTDNKLYVGFGTQGTIIQSEELSLNTRYKISALLKNGEQVLKIDDLSYTASGSTWNPAYESENGNVFLFARNTDGTASSFSKIKLYKFAMYDYSGELIRYYIPCYRKSDSVIGLYDLVGKQFYTNSGTGTFNKGENFYGSFESVTEKILDLEDDITSYRGYISDETSSNFSALFNNTTGDVSAYIFFTDPHIYNTNVTQESINNLINTIKKYYRNTPSSMVLCGGDWLHSGDTREVACEKLGFIKGIMNKEFKESHLILGNHDNNSWDYNDTILTDQTIKNIWFDGNNAYYTFKSNSTRFYVFDNSYYYYDENMPSYYKTQIEWFGQQLMSNTDTHIVLTSHMVINMTYGNNKLSEKITEMANAFNNRQSFTYDGNVYDFSQSTGTIHYYIAGHNHADANSILNNIPYILTANALTNHTIPTFDLCLADYSSNKLHLIRVGSGSNREIAIL